MKRKVFAVFAMFALVLATNVLLPETGVAQVAAGDQTGSLLVTPKFDIKGNKETVLRIENTGNSTVQVKLNYICPGTIRDQFCDALDRVTGPITPRGTAVVDVRSQVPPCNQGYVVAFAFNGTNAMSYNFLTGSYNIFQGKKHEADGMIAVQSTQAEGTDLGEELQFGPDPIPANQDYESVGTTLYSGFRAAGSGPNRGSRLTLLTLNTLAGQSNPITSVDIDWWSADEEPFSTSDIYVCWKDIKLSNLSSNFEEGPLGSTYGLIQVVPAPTCPVPGTCPPDPEFVPVVLGSMTEFSAGIRANRALSHDGTPSGGIYIPR